MRTRSPAVLIAALAPASLLAVDPWGWYPFGPVKWLAVSVLVPAGAALVLARRPLRVAAAPTAAALGLVAWLAVAAAVGVDGVYAWVGTPERHLGVVAWALAALALVVGQSLDGDEDRRVVAGGLVLAGLGVGVVAVAEALGWEPDALDTGSRLSGTLGSPAYLGAAAGLLLPALVGVAADGSWARRARVAAAAGAAGLAVALVGSGARAAWVGLAAAVVVTVWAQRAWLAGRRRIVVAAAAAGVALVGLVLVGPVGERAASTFDASEPGGGGRLDEWRVAGRVVVDHPLVGVGPEGYRIAFAEGADAAYELEHGRDPLPDRAHSAPLDVALAGGLPALAAWLALVVLVGRVVLVVLRGDRPWLVGIAAGLVAHVVGSLFLFPVVELEPLVWLLGGLVLGAAPARPAAPGRPRRVERPLPRPVPAAVGLLAVLALVAGAADVAADRHARRAADALDRGDTATAAEEAAAASRLRPDEVRLHLLEARARVADEQGIVAGIGAVDDALAVSGGDPIAQRERARLLVARAEATRAPAHVALARAEVDRLLADDPVSSTLWALASVAAALDGDTAGADEALRRAEELRPETRDGT